VLDSERAEHRGVAGVIEVAEVEEAEDARRVRDLEARANESDVVRPPALELVLLALAPLLLRP
jgi:hypothetical protein